MAVIRKQELFGAYVVMTTRQTRETDYTSEFNFRHVTVSGFKLTSVRRFINCIIDDSKRSEQLVGYLDEHILPPDVESLPLNLSALCELSLWTNGEVFRRRLRTSELFCILVKCLFDGAAYKTRRQSKALSSGSDQTTEGHQPTLDKRCDGSDQTMEGYQLTQDQQELLVNLGKTVLPRVLENHCTMCELSRKDFGQFVENKNNAFDEGVTIGLLREQVGGSASQTEQKAYFVLEILQDLCVGIRLARTDKELTSCLDKMLHSGTTFAKVFLFAGLPSYTAYLSIMEALTKTIKEIRSSLKSLKPMLGKLIDPNERNNFLQLTQRYMQLIEVCLQLQHESKCGVILPIEMVSNWLPIEKASKWSGKAKIRLIGVSSHKLRLLSYFVNDQSISPKIKSIELFRLGNYPSRELRKYMEYFLPHVFEDTDERTSELQKSDDDSLTLRALLEKVESTLKGEVDMSSTCQFDLDTSVILSLQSSFLQDAMMLSQSDKCFLSYPAKDFARCLPNTKDLEKIVLIGSILSSEIICELARNLKKLPKLKRLDLRLNKQIDDAAFLEVTQSASSCKSMVDLRLSLYKVTLRGYDEVLRCSEIDRDGWKRLKKLFLLHGAPTEGFVIFLSRLAKYLMGVEVFTIAALNSSDGLSREAIGGFRDAIMSIKSLKKIQIENREDLRKEIKLASKDQKRQGSSIDLPIDREICGGSETSPVEDFVIIPEQPEQNRDEEERTEQLAT